MAFRNKRITDSLALLLPEILEVIDDSESHKGHFGIEVENIETHFIINIKADFGTLSLVEKHRKINSLIKSEFNNGLHAVVINIL